MHVALTPTRKGPRLSENGLWVHDGDGCHAHDDLGALPRGRQTRLAEEVVAVKRLDGVT